MGSVVSSFIRSRHKMCQAAKGPITAGYYIVKQLLQNVMTGFRRGLKGIVFVAACLLFSLPSVPALDQTRVSGSASPVCRIYQFVYRHLTANS